MGRENEGSENQSNHKVFSVRRRRGKWTHATDGDRDRGSTHTQTTHARTHTRGLTTPTGVQAAKSATLSIIPAVDVAVMLASLTFTHLLREDSEVCEPALAVLVVLVSIASLSSSVSELSEAVVSVVEGTTGDVDGRDRRRVRSFCRHRWQ